MSPRQAGPKALAVRAVLAAAAAVVLLFAVQGGEWGTFDLFRQQSRLGRLRHDVDSLRRDVDSLTRYKKALETDPVLQEKLAREEFGMLRGTNELLYRFVDPESTSVTGKPRKP
ncbi:MAG TPA: septum formation initiator family protein [Gemmatimonadaceae bacterium]|nr:septum formation initiator family protein [Gemmatimonadaceae bacterium]